VLSPVFPPAHGGIETLTRGIVDHLPDDDVLIVTLREPGSDAWDAGYDREVRRSGNRPRGGRRSIIRLTVRAVAEAVRFRPDLVLSMHVRTGYAAQAVRVLTGARWVQYYHAKEISEFAGATARCVRHADAHVGPSRYTRSLLGRAGLPESAVRVLHPAAPAIDRPADAAPRRPHSMLTVARLADENKGHDVIIRALAEVRREFGDVRWTVVGDGPMRPALEGMAVEAGVDELIDWRGSVGDEVRNRCLFESDIFVMPSRIPVGPVGGEGFGIAYLEAAAAGLPVIAANEGGATDAVDPPSTGLLVDPRDPAAVATAVRTLFRSREGIEAMRSASSRWAARFTWERLVDGLEEVFDSVPGGSSET